MSNGMTGFNPEKAMDLQNELKRIFENVGEEIAAGWPSVKNVMQTNWIGEDEMSYEEAFIGRLNWLYEQAATAVNGVNECIVGWANSWWEFQKNNHNYGGVSSQSYSKDINVTQVTVEATKLITFEERDIASSVDRGILDGTAGTIKSSIQGYVDQIKAKVQGLYDGIHEAASAAFFGGSQTGAIEEFISKVGDAFATVLTAVKDMYEAIDNLTSENYQASDESMSSGLNSQDVTSTIEEGAVNADMRWN